MLKLFRERSTCRKPIGPNCCVLCNLEEFRPPQSPDPLEDLKRIFDKTGASGIGSNDFFNAENRGKSTQHQLDQLDQLGCG